MRPASIRKEWLRIINVLIFTQERRISRWSSPMINLVGSRLPQWTLKPYSSTIVTITPHLFGRFWKSMTAVTYFTHLNPLTSQPGDPGENFPARHWRRRRRIAALSTDVGMSHRCLCSWQQLGLSPCVQLLDVRRRRTVRWYFSVVLIKVYVCMNNIWFYIYIKNCYIYILYDVYLCT